MWLKMMWSEEASAIVDSYPQLVQQDHCAGEHNDDGDDDDDDGGDGNDYDNSDDDGGRFLQWLAMYTFLIFRWTDAHQFMPAGLVMKVKESRFNGI